jgi:hypothetical protein
MCSKNLKTYRDTFLVKILDVSMCPKKFKTKKKIFYYIF